MQMGRNPIRLNGALPYGGSNALGIAAIDGQNYTAVKHETVRAAQRWPSDCASALTLNRRCGTGQLGRDSAVGRNTCGQTCSQHCSSLGRGYRFQLQWQGPDRGHRR